MFTEWEEMIIRNGREANRKGCAMTCFYGRDYCFYNKGPCTWKCYEFLLRPFWMTLLFIGVLVGIAVFFGKE